MIEMIFRSNMTVELIKASAADKDVVFAARVSTLGENSLASVGRDASADAGLIDFLVRNRHSSPLEHTQMTFYVEAPIFVWREFMRHRIASYNEESGRYRELQPVFYVPGPERNLVQHGKPGAYEFMSGSEDQHALVVEMARDSASYAYENYLVALEAGIAREVARIWLPLNIYSSAYVTMNARALTNFLSLRTKSPDAALPSYPQREIEMVAEQMEAIWADLMPITHAAFVKNGRVAL